ncbi:triose-phosphate transporter family-domain-containing protein [Ilyonectria robusta]|uniref:triose-phosphate transporter family-domain-containing protein n=1 Tax=Ilyonectria robusta TaxID=1079257 RepID=UPI001E8CD011|nr:triose-phosphate transporter family-domain-containing protein [Ilyonectria robusta]KAH8735317.1 triose-phosphate transporter family-domain-containing protein [Ilyonectria robusta]
MEKFPDLIDPPMGVLSRSPSPHRPPPSFANGNPPRTTDRWFPVGKPDHSNGLGWSAGGRGHSRQKSLGDAFRNIRARNGSVGQNAQEIAEALRAPVSPKLIILCLLWYTSSALTNTSSKSILNAFPKPATLTLIQFAFVSSLCISIAKLAVVFPVLRTKITALKYPIRKPTREVIMTTLPLAVFQIGGHLLSSAATSKIPVSLVHTIKGLSPLFTVFAYRFVYDIRYPTATYLSLIPLTLGVMLACSGKTTYGGELIGVIQALLAAIIFVSQNIFSKKLFNEAAKAEAEAPGVPSKKLDKLNLLCYSSGMAFILTMPIWFWTEGLGLIKNIYQEGSVDLANTPNAMDHGRLSLEFAFNGVSHFGQNILAFVLLSMVSPVTYSVASLIKRVFVIILAILWFRSPTTPMQAVGIALTFLGLYLYDRTSESNKADRKAQMMAQGKEISLLPMTNNGTMPTTLVSSPRSTISAHPYGDGYRARGTSIDKRPTQNGRHTPSGSNTGWLPPGTKQEDTWRTGDRVAGVS